MKKKKCNWDIYMDIHIIYAFFTTFIPHLAASFGPKPARLKFSAGRVVDEVGGVYC